MANIQIKPGIVREIDIHKQRILVELCPNTLGGCGESCNCSSLALSGKPRGAKVWIPFNSQRALKINDAVMVRAALPSPYLAILLVFVMPIISLLFGAFLGDALAKQYDLLSHQTLLTAGCALGVFMLALVLAVVFDHWYRKVHPVFTLISPQQSYALGDGSNVAFEDVPTVTDLFVEGTDSSSSDSSDSSD